MKFLVDAQLPNKLANWLGSKGHDTIHTLDLDLQNRTPDGELIRIAREEERVIITKDSDFMETRILTGQPQKLLLISTGNIPNGALLELFEKQIDSVASAFDVYSFVEITRSELVIHE
jgi:predicted nuclease of predicted toxin-antitoxin system